jgi:hypothetical protein
MTVDFRRVDELPDVSGGVLAAGDYLGVSNPTDYGRRATPLQVRKRAEDTAPNWASYGSAVSLWTASGSNPVIADGSFTAAWKRTDRYTALFRLNVTIGSLTTLGSGTYFFQLPVGSPVGVPQVIDGYLFDLSANLYLPLTGVVSNSTFTAAASSGALAGPSTPIALAQGDQFCFSGSINTIES